MNIKRTLKISMRSFNIQIMPIYFKLISSMKRLPKSRSSLSTKSRTTLIWSTRQRWKVSNSYISLENHQDNKNLSMIKSTISTRSWPCLATSWPKLILLTSTWKKHIPVSKIYLSLETKCSNKTIKTHMLISRVNVIITKPNCHILKTNRTIILKFSINSTPNKIKFLKVWTRNSLSLKMNTIILWTKKLTIKSKLVHSRKKTKRRKQKTESWMLSLDNLLTKLKLLKITSINWLLLMLSNLINIKTLFIITMKILTKWELI